MMKIRFRIKMLIKKDFSCKLDSNQSRKKMAENVQQALQEILKNINLLVDAVLVET